MLETSHPLALDPKEYGWMRDVKNKSLSPITVPDDVKLAPEYVLEMIRCGCKSESPCNSRRWLSSQRSALHNFLCLLCSWLLTCAVARFEEIGEATSSRRLFVCFTNLIDLTVGQTKHIECLTQSILHQCQQVRKQEMTLKSHAIILEWFLCNNASKTPVVYRCSNVLCWVKSVRKGLILSIKSLFYF